MMFDCLITKPIRGVQNNTSVHFKDNLRYVYYSSHVYMTIQNSNLNLNSFLEVALSYLREGPVSMASCQPGRWLQGQF